jgi:hypothetical protein
MKKLLLLVLICLSPLPAICDVTLWGMRAELWQKNNHYDKVVYVQGVFDGMVFSEYTVHGTKLSTKITVPQYVSAIDTLYSDYKNSLVPVPFLMRIITLEVEGADKSAVDEVLEDYRKQFSKK